MRRTVVVVALVALGVTMLIVGSMGMMASSSAESRPTCASCHE